MNRSFSQTDGQYDSSNPFPRNFVRIIAILAISESPAELFDIRMESSLEDFASDIT